MTDIAKKIVMMMNEQGVAGLPRNYELFYESVTGTNQELSKELARLGAEIHLLNVVPLTYTGLGATDMPTVSF